MIYDKHNTTPTHERECSQCGSRWNASGLAHPRYEGEPVLCFCDSCRRYEIQDGERWAASDEPEWTTVNPITGEVDE